MDFQLRSRHDECTALPSTTPHSGNRRSCLKTFVERTVADPPGRNHSRIASSQHSARMVTPAPPPHHSGLGTESGKRPEFSSGWSPGLRSGRSPAHGRPCPSLHPRPPRHALQMEPATGTNIDGGGGFGIAGSGDFLIASDAARAQRSARHP